jgi:hypothetical protein
MIESDGAYVNPPPCVSQHLAPRLWYARKQNQVSPHQDAQREGGLPATPTKPPCSGGTQLCGRSVEPTASLQFCADTWVTPRKQLSGRRPARLPR